MNRHEIENKYNNYKTSENEIVIPSCDFSDEDIRKNNKARRSLERYFERRRLRAELVDGFSDL